MSTKVCRACGKEKELSDFYKKARTADGKTSECIECFKNRQKVLYYKHVKEDPDYQKKQYANRIDPVRKLAWSLRELYDVRDNHFKNKYGISLKEYTDMVEKQGGVCALCGKEETQRSWKGNDTPRFLAVDHDHKTGKIRG